MSTLTETRATDRANAVVEMTYRDAINLALKDEMSADPSVVLMGEDVAASGGVFKTNEGVAEMFPGRVLTTPICENGFTGVALGMALLGNRLAQAGTLSAEAQASIAKDVQEEIDGAAARAAQAPYPTLEETAPYVYAD